MELQLAVGPVARAIPLGPERDQRGRPVLEGGVAHDILMGDRVGKKGWRPGQEGDRRGGRGDGRGA